MRSGHHAVMNWIYQGLSGYVVFANNITGILWNPSPTDSRYKEFTELFLNGNAICNNMVDVWCDIPKCATKPLICRGIEKFDKNRHPDFIMDSIEDDPIANYKDGILHEKELLSFTPNNNHERFGIGLSKSITNVLILRDPYNYIASRLAKNNPILLPNAIENWKIHAKKYLEINNNLVCINFNKWVKSESYRNELANKLGFTNKETGLNEIPSYGNGSSFTKTSLPSRDAVLFRYKSYLHDPEYTNYFDDETAIIAKKIFGSSFIKML